MSCMDCDLISGKVDVPGGTILRTENWIIDHCIGPLNLGTLIVKPLRHCVHVWELTPEEALELGPLLKKTSGVIQNLTGCDQVYVCLWSHMYWRPGHIHFVLQPSWNDFKDSYDTPGPGRCRFGLPKLHKTAL